MIIPLIALAAALLYLIASRAGWLDDLGRRQAGPGPRERPRVLPRARGKVDPKDRLEVFEEFLRHLGRDDSDPEA